MPIRPDMTRADSRRHRPLPDREGILSPVSGRARFEYAILDHDSIRHCVGADGRPPLQARVHPRSRRADTRPCRGIAGGNNRWMENRHPSACFARQSEWEQSRTASGLHIPGQGIVRDRSNLPLPLPHREGKDAPHLPNHHWTGN
jgi:hypothetical protein